MNFSDFKSFNQINSSMANPRVSPTTSRPILGSNRINDSFNYWEPKPEVRRMDRMDSWSTSSNSDESPTVLTPIGSPLKYSARVWPQFVNKYNQNPKDEFEANGRDVTDWSTNHSYINGRPLFQKNTVQQPTPTYQLFNGFSYAKMKTSVGANEVGNRFKVKRRIKTQTFCSFCKNNNETADVYNSHVVKDPYGRTTCPVLRDYDCPKCRSGGGDNGHTIRYCPQNRPGFEDYIPSVIKQLKNSRTADGKKRNIIV